MCMRCYQLSHYGKLRGTVDVSKPEELHHILAQRITDQYKTAVFIKIVDIFDLHGSMIPEFEVGYMSRLALSIAEKRRNPAKSLLLFGCF